MTAVADTAERAARAREMIGGEPDDLTLARFLHGLEDAGVVVVLQFPQNPDDLRVAADPADAPARHVVGLGAGVELHAHLFGPGHR